MTLREAAQQALEALTNCTSEYGHRCNRCDSEVDEGGKVVDALHAALEEPVQEPVAIVGTREGTWKGYEGQWLPPGPPIKTVHMLRDLPQGTPLYTSPPQHKPLTDEKMRECAQAMDAEPLNEGWPELIKFARAVERAHGIGVE